jgi:hypothetical protein
MSSRRNWHLRTGLWIAAEPLALLAQDKRSERRQLHRLAAFNAIGDFLQDRFYERRAFGPR